MKKNLIAVLVAVLVVGSGGCTFSRSTDKDGVRTPSSFGKLIGPKTPAEVSAFYGDPGLFRGYSPYDRP
ncbi:MAG: hypothetical protein V4699_01435 [Patescibacteria group bacterium]